MYDNTIPSMRLSVISMHTKSPWKTHKQYLMALEVIKVKAPIDVLAVTKLQREGWMGRIQVVAWPYSPDDKQIQTFSVYSLRKLKRKQWIELGSCLPY